MSKLLFFSSLFLVAVALASGPAGATQYCAQYYNGTYDCGIPSLSSCQQSVSGVGGICVVDKHSQQRTRRFRLFPANPYPDPTMPPPPPY
jgi:hypothetical protein